MVIFVLLVGCVVEGVPAKLILVLILVTYVPDPTLWLPDLVLGPDGPVPKN